MKTTMKKIGLSAVVAVIMTTSLNAGGAVAGALEPTQWARFGAETLDRANAYTTQLREYATQIQQYQQQVQQYVNQFNSYKMMLQNIGQLPQQQWDQFSQSIIGLKKSLDFGKSLNFTASSYDADFKKMFPGFDKYLLDAKNGGNSFEQTYKDLSASTTDTVNSALKSLGLRANDLQNDEAVMRQLQTLSSSAPGQKAAIQVANEIALHQTHQLKKLEQTVIQQTRVQSQWILDKQKRDELQKAQQKAFLDKADFSIGDNHKKNTRRIHR